MHHIGLLFPYSFQFIDLICESLSNRQDYVNQQAGNKYLMKKNPILLYQLFHFLNIY